VKTVLSLSCLVWFSTQLIRLSLSLSLSLSRERASLHAHTLLVTIFNSHNCFLLKTFGLIGNQKKKKLYSLISSGLVQDLQEWVEGKGDS
jgi:hypothetical protein